MTNADHSKSIRKAVKYYWKTKSAALTKNQKGPKADQGKRGAATAGKNFDGMEEMFAKLAKQYGGKNLNVYQNKGQVVLPGHFRPSKQWDLVATCKDRLIAVLEFKALGGPSFGNNANNRCEEALGSGLDLSVAQREGLFGAGANPFIGYCILVEDEEGSRREPKRGTASAHFAADPIFEKASYQHRIRILCERMIQERIYTAAAVITSPSKAIKDGRYADISEAASLNKLIARFIAHIAIETRD